MLSGPANVLVMPGLRAPFSLHRLETPGQAGGGPPPPSGQLLLGLTHAVQIVPMEATVADIVNTAVMGCYHTKRL